MLEEQNTGDAALSALGLHDANEARAFARTCDLDPEVAAALAEFEDIVALAAVATSPAEEPPHTCLSGALAEIGVPGIAPVVRGGFRQARWGWAAAACFAATTAWFAIERTAVSPEIASGDKAPAAKDPVASGAKDPLADTLDQLLRERGIFPRTASGGNTHSNSVSRSHALALIQDLTSLEAQLDALRAEDAARFTPIPGLARTVVVEMTDPAEATAEATEEDALTERVTDILVEGLAGEIAPASDDTAPPPEGTVRPDASFSSLDDPDLVSALERGETVLLELPAGIADWSGFDVFENGVVYDDSTGTPRFWVPTDQPGSYIASPAPEGFLPGLAEDDPTLLPQPVTLAPPVEQPTAQEPAPALLEEPVSAPTPPEDIPLRLAILFDEASGEGTLITPNFNPTGPVVIEAYDNLTDAPITIGQLPELVNPVETIDFTIPGAISPDRFTLRYQNPDGSLGGVIVTGPGTEPSVP